ncbi:sensor domain-containing diguanylate cyclase [Vogesella oryzae]|uniref:sensor domain-containing diguanylate cyclase n=1 Tax=Vogesella oryzae TaxID=1735285 RepID=UPI001581A893|nr:sensor domain-containing diguanylate cyclase [Vogesella oryzae]
MDNQPRRPDRQQLQHELSRLQQQLATLQQENVTLQEKLNAALDGTGLCLWQGLLATGELQVFNLQGFQAGDMAANFDIWYAKVHPDDRERVVANYQAHLRGDSDSYEAEYRTIGPDGRITWLWDRGRVLERAADGTPLRIMGSHVDITPRKENELALLRMARHDALTGLPNRAEFYHQLGDAIADAGRQARGLAVLFVDLDLFKELNDRFGHVIGDKALCAVACELRQIVREGDLVARLGGDEFILFLRDEAGCPSVEHVSQRILAALNRSFSLDGNLVALGASIGTSLYPADGSSAEALVQHADAAMYAAKAGGRSRVRHYVANTATISG